MYPVTPATADFIHFAAFDNAIRDEFTRLFYVSNATLYELEEFTPEENEEILRACATLAYHYTEKKYGTLGYIPLTQSMERYVHLMGVTILCIVSKWECDYCEWGNEMFAIMGSDRSVELHVTPPKIKEVNALERDILSTLDYNIYRYMREYTHTPK